MKNNRYKISAAILIFVLTHYYRPIFAQNVGIGTANPSAKLHVAGNQKIDGANTLEFGAGIAGKDFNAGKIGYEVFTPGALDIVGAGISQPLRKIKFWNEGGALFAGNIGIGISQADAPLQFSNALVNRKIVLWDAFNNNHQYLGFGVNPGMLRYQVGSSINDSHVFFAGTSDSTSQELMRITGTGNAGIGTSSPSAKLHVAGNVKIDSIYTLEFGAGIAGKEVNAGKIGYQTFTPDALDIIGAGASGPLRKIKFWNEGGAEFAGSVTVNGNVNMGLTDRVVDFAVAGNTTAGYTLACPGGTRLISGGGGHRDFNAAANDIHIRYSGPDINAPLDAWRLVIDNTSSSSRTIRVYCNCARIN